MSDKPKIVTVPLEQPLKRGEEKIESLQLRKPDAGSLRGLSMIDLVKMDTTAIAKLLPRISQPALIDAEVAELDPADLFAIGVEISDFFMTAADRERAAFLKP